MSNPFIDASLTATFYIYVTLAKPDDPNFTARGGKVYIIVVYDGRIKNQNGMDNTFGFLEYDTNNLRLPPGVQLPVPGSEQVIGNTRIYTIDFAQTMSMYNNSGNSTFNFPARYKHTHHLAGYRQTKYEKPLPYGPTAGWSQVFISNAGPYEERCDMYGLQVYETNTLAAPRCSIFFGQEGSGSSSTFGNAFILDYSAETMANAVVGSNTIGIHSPMSKPSEGQPEWFARSSYSDADAGEASA